MKFTLDKVIEGIANGEEGSICLAPDEAFTFTKILLGRGYAVLFTGGDMGDDIRVDWKYAGDVENLKWANRRNVVFGDPDYVDMLIEGDYGPDEED